MEQIFKCKHSQNRSKFNKVIRIKNGSGPEDVHYPLFHKDLPEEFKAYAKTELNETEENKTAGIKAFRSILKRESIENFDDKLMMFFLRTSKYNLSKAEAKLMKYQKTCRKMMSLVAEMDMDLIEGILDEDVFGVLPYRDQHGRAIFFTRHSLNPLISTNLEDCVVLAIATAYLLGCHSPISSVAGVSNLASHKDVPLLHYYDVIKSLRKYSSFWMCLPSRYRRIDVVYEHPFTRFFYKITRPFASAKYGERICFHGSSTSSLHQNYHPDILPEEFGGNLGPIRQISFREDMLNMIKIIKENPEKF